MNPFFARLADRLHSAETEQVGASLSDISELFRNWTRFGGDPNPPGAVGPFSEDLDFPPTGTEQVEFLKGAVVSFIEENMDSPVLVSAIHGLYVLGDVETKNLLRRVLRFTIHGDSKAMFQTLLALETLGEPIFDPNETSRSYDWVEINRAAATSYLEGLGDAV